MSSIYTDSRKASLSVASTKFVSLGRNTRELLRDYVRKEQDLARYPGSAWILRPTIRQVENVAVLLRLYGQVSRHEI